MGLKEELEQTYFDYKKDNYPFKIYENYQDLKEDYINEKTFVFPAKLGNAFLRDCIIVGAVLFMTFISLVFFIIDKTEIANLDQEIPISLPIVTGAMLLTGILYLIIRYWYFLGSRYICVGKKGFLFRNSRKKVLVLKWGNIKDVDAEERFAKVSDGHYEKFYLIVITLKSSGDKVNINLRFFSDKEFKDKTLLARVFNMYFSLDYKSEEIK